MRNLKKVLSMIMAVAMMMSLVVFSASATSFNDDKNIVNKEAVDMATALKIINGLPDGSFNPTGNVTRAEMAKMICILLNGGNEPTVGAKTGNATFNDIRGHWAEGYIEYCVAEGIIAGMGDGTFQPNGQVTGTQAAKMLLVAMGFRADVEGFNGANWAVKINVRATQKKFYNDISVTSVNAPLSRDNAAQMIWNALNANVVEYDYELITVDGQLQSVLTAKDKLLSVNNYLTLLADKYNSKDQYGTLDSITWDTKTKEYIYALSGTTSGPATFKSKVDYTNLFAMNVKVVYRTVGTTTTLLGIVPDESTVLATGTFADMSFDALTDTSFKLDGTKISVDSALDTLQIQAKFAGTSANFNTIASGDEILAAKDVFNNYKIKVLDVDGNNKADLIVYEPFTTAKVISKSSTKVVVDELRSNVVAPARTYDLEDDNIYDGITVDDYVVITLADNTADDANVITKMDSFEGTVDGVKSAQARVNNTWYDLMSNNGAANSLPEADADSEYTFYAVGNYVYYTDKISGSSLTDVAYVADAQNGAGSGMMDKDEALLYFADGTSKTVVVDEVKGFDGPNYPGNTAVAAKGFLVTYKEKSGKYTLTRVGEINGSTLNKDNVVGMDGYVGSDDGTNYDNGYQVTTPAKRDGKLIFAGTNATTFNGTSLSLADDAVVFVQYTDNTKLKVKVYTGKQIKDLKNAGTSIDSTSTAAALYDTLKGVDSVKVAALNAFDTSKPSVSGDTGNYGMIVDVYKSTLDGDSITKVDLWNGTEIAKVYIDGTSDFDNGDLKKKTVIEYSALADGEIDVVTIFNSATNNLNKAIVGINGKEVRVNNGSTAAGTSYYITDDTVILNVDTSKSTPVGSASELVQLAVKTFDDDGVHTGYQCNALIVTDGATDELALLVVDIAGEYKYPS